MISSRFKRHPATVTFVLLAVLLVTSTVQASHLCGGASTANSTQASVESSKQVPCQVCSMAQTATTAPALTSVPVPYNQQERVSFSALRPRLVVDFFELSVRPPPSL
jgi:hypothetical protein